MNQLVILDDTSFIPLEDVGASSILGKINNMFDIDYWLKGFSLKSIVNMMKSIKTEDHVLFTRDKIYLLDIASEYFYDEDTKRFEVYLIRNNRLINIHDTTEKEIRKEHNLYKMYCNGAFDSDLTK